MIEKTFCHVEGISKDSENLLWEEGISNWEDFLEHCSSLTCLSQNKLDKIKAELYSSKKALSNNDILYFKDKLPSKEHHRLLPYGKVAFVDIETTGLSKWSHELTMLGIYDGDHAISYIAGINLEEGYERLKDFDIVVSFNGKQFDLPFIEQKSGYVYDCIHLDLRFMLKEYELSGGLKKIERELGISRPDTVAEVDGFEAVRLWRRYKQGSTKALRKLLEYNKEDIVNLKTILEWYLEKKQETLRI